MSLEEVAELTGKSTSFIRQSMVEGTCPFGFCISKGRQRIDYFISRKKVTEYIGE